MACRPPRFDKFFFLPRSCGLIVVGVGALMVLLFVPLRFWLGIIGVALIALGIMLWRNS